MKRQWFVFVFLVFLMCFSLPQNTVAENKKSLSVQIITDQTSYHEDEIATLTIRITNNTGKTIRNLKMNNILPDELSYISWFAEPYCFPSIVAGQTVEEHFQVRMKKVDGKVTLHITTDKPAYQKNEIATLRIRMTNHTDHRLTNIRMNNLLPDGLSYVPLSKETQSFPVLEPDSTMTHTLQVRLLQNAVPPTGDSNDPHLWLMMAFFSLVCIVWLLRRKGLSVISHEHKQERI